jgi:hypothetical protein
MSRLWPPAEGAQVDYERLRAAVLAGAPLLGQAAARFARCGLAGLIAHPAADEDGQDQGFLAVLGGARRPAWSPHADPRLDALAAGYGLLLSVAEGASIGRTEVH